MRVRDLVIFPAEPSSNPRRKHAAMAFGVLAVLGLVSVGASTFGDATGAATPEVDVLGQPGLCLEVASGEAAASQAVQVSTLDMAAGQPDFFADAIETSHQENGKLGIWGEAAAAPSTAEDRGASLAGIDCGRGSAAWGLRISQPLLLAGAERILAAARVSETGEPPIPENAKASIDVRFDEAEQRIRTVLEFDVPVGPFRLGGTCWIDDAIGLDTLTGSAVTTATSGMDVDPFVESGCQKFQDFMTAGGAGQMALAMVPRAAQLDDGTTLRLVVGSVTLGTSAMMLAGTIERS